MCDVPLIGAFKPVLRDSVPESFSSFLFFLSVHRSRQNAAIHGFGRIDTPRVNLRVALAIVEGVIALQRSEDSLWRNIYSLALVSSGPLFYSFYVKSK